MNKEYMSSQNQGSPLGAKTAVDSAPRRRRWAPKVRTGCLTCKIRRVKCDEARPSCGKCLSTGRKCDGYEDEEKELDLVDSTNAKAANGRSKGHHPYNAVITQPRQQKDTSSTRLSSSPYCVSWIPFYGGELEKKNFDFFQSVTSSSLAGFHGSEFWARDTLQVAHQYPALFHAITAFGNIHHCYLSDVTPCDIPRATADSSGIEFGLREFNKAIKWMYKLIAQEQITFRDQQAILTTCILFTCLIFVRGIF
ncbi:hypothetical protein UA08_02563 [Talaromyces atroroseus]|uniref:Zn(2)-C6 fungal-type domain-containing protein n=1 Tax=Talaromyces atroroseus TaxID=1441469 RepID=A0A225AR50_TALAT|nr:hypothetical protein UA08_02563 [Talaromyces atroroseus]OKL61973.1 hypothetical protein UA08_02563 [Talaromyces atroroseus]